MNKYKFILISVLASVLASVLFSCSDELGAWQNLENVQFGAQPHYLYASKKNVDLASSSNKSATISISSINTSWALTNVPNSWLSVSPDRGTDSAQVTIWATENTSGYDSRIALLSLKSLADDYSYSSEIVVSQSAGVPFIRPEQTSLVTDWDAATLEVNVNSNVDWKPVVEDGASWLSVARDGSKLLVNVDKNFSEDRSTEIFLIDVNSDKSLAMVNVKQGKTGISVNVDHLDFDCHASSQILILDAVVAVSDFKIETTESWLSASMTRLNDHQIEVSVSALDNLSVQSRNGYVYLLLGSDKKVSISVAQKGAAFTVEANLEDFKGDGTSENKLKVIADDSWQVYSKPSWLSVDPETGDAGETLLSLIAAKNISLFPREGVLSLGLSRLELKQDITVKQAGLDIDPENMVSFGWEASEKQLDVSFPSSWEATCSEEWIALSKQKGMGPDLILVSVQTNNAENGRTGEIAFVTEGKKYIVSVVQEGQYLKIESTSTQMTAIGGDISIDVQSSVGVKDSISYNDGEKDWITVERSKENGYVLHIAQNTSTHDRFASFYILPTRSTTNEACKSGVKLSIEQKGRNLQVSVRRINFYGKGGLSETYSIKSDGEYEIKKGENSSWYVVNHSKEANSFSIKADANPVNEKRIDTLVFVLKDLPVGEFCSQSVVLVQHGKDVDEGDVDENGFAQVSEGILTYDWQESEQVVKIDANVDWIFKVKSGAEWIQVDSGLDKLIVRVAKNYSESREGQIGIFNAKTKVELAKVIIQQGRVEVSSSVENVNFGINGGSQTVTVESTAPISEFTVESSASWLSLSLNNESDGKGALQITATPNKSLSTRSGEAMLLLGKNKRLSINVSQEALSFKVEGNLDIFDAMGTKTNTLTVRSNDVWKVIAKPQWLKVSPESGEAGEYQLSLNAEQNLSVNTRTDSLKLGLVGFDLTQSFEVKQLSMNASVESRMDFDWEENSKGTEINIPGEWTAEPSSDWISLSKLSGTGAQTLVVSLKANDSEFERVGKVFLKSEGKEYEITIVQGGQYFEVKASSGKVGVAGGEITVEVNSSVGAIDSISYVGTQNHWITVNRPGEDKFVLQVAGNKSSQPRMADFYVMPTKKVTNSNFKSGFKVAVEQPGRLLQVAVDNIIFTQKGGQSETYEIKADGDYTLIKANGDSWYSVKFDALKNTFFVIAEENLTSVDRTGTLTISLRNLPEGEVCEKKISIKQYAKDVDAGLDDFGDDENWNPASL